MRRMVVVAAALTMLAPAACARPGLQAVSGTPSAGASVGGASASAGVLSGTATTDVTTSPSPNSPTAQVWQLRYVLLGHYPDFAYCDPDLYPIARGDEQSAADDW